MTYYVPPWKKDDGGGSKNRSRGNRNTEFTPPDKPPVTIDRILKCKVTRLLDFGFFAEIVTKSRKKISGLCHVSNIIGKPKIDNVVFVKVINVRYNVKRGRWDIGFTMKNIDQKTGKLINPEEEGKKIREEGFTNRNRRRNRRQGEDPSKPPVPVDTIVKCKVVSFKEFGFFCDFVELVKSPSESGEKEEGKHFNTKISGLCHKTKMSHQDVTLNDLVFVRVNSVNWNEGKMKWDVSVSMRYINQETGEWDKDGEKKEYLIDKIPQPRIKKDLPDPLRILSDEEIDEMKPKFKIGDVSLCLIKEFNNLGFFGDIKCSDDEEEEEEEDDEEEGKVIRGLCPFNQVFGNPNVGDEVFTKIHKIVWKEHRQKWEVFISMKHVDQKTGELLRPSVYMGSGEKRRGRGHYRGGRRHHHHPKEEFRKKYPEICRKRSCSLDYCRRFHPWTWFNENVVDLEVGEDVEEKCKNEEDSVMRICLETKKKLEESKQEICDSEKFGTKCECGKFHIVEDFYKPIRMKFSESSFNFLKKDEQQQQQQQEEEDEGEGDETTFTSGKYRSFEMFSTNPVVFSVVKKKEAEGYDVFVLLGLERERRKNLGIKKHGILDDSSELGHLKMSFTNFSGKFEILPKHVKEEETRDRDILDCTRRILRKHNMHLVSPDPPTNEEIREMCNNRVVFFTSPIYKMLLQGCHNFLLPIDHFNIEEVFKRRLMKLENEEGKWVGRSNYTWLKVDEEFFERMKNEIVVGGSSSNKSSPVVQEEIEEEEQQQQQQDDDDDDDEQDNTKKKKMESKSNYQHLRWKYRKRYPGRERNVFEIENSRKYQYEYNKKVILGEKKFLFRRGEIHWEEGDLKAAREAREKNDFNGVLEKQRNGSYAITDTCLIQILAFEDELLEAGRIGDKKFERMKLKILQD